MTHIARCLDRRVRCLLTAAALLTTVSCADEARPTSAPVASFAVATGRPTAKVGGPIDLRFTFTATGDPTIDASYWVMVHFVDSEGQVVWGDDHRPPTSTVDWKAGTPVEYTRTLFVPTSVEPGELSVLVGLYSPDTQIRAALVGEQAEPGAYRAGRLAIQPAEVLEYTRGWYDHEGSPSDPVRWRWTTGQATLAFRNPKANAILFLEVEASQDFPSAQQVTISLAGQVVDTFEAPPRGRLLRRIALTSTQLGTDERAEATIVVDKTYSPADLTGGTSADKRQLGIRVFNASIEPAP